MLFHMYEHFGTNSGPETAITGLIHLWQGYLRHGRRQLLTLGNRVVLEPEFASGFGKADLIVGRCLVDVKAVRDPTKYYDFWLNQLLCYALLDWSDIFRLDTVAIYLGWHAMLIHEPLTALLAASTPGPTPSIADLRTDFRVQIQAEVDNEFSNRMSWLYPPPLRP
jgi:hypothetical protein